MTIFVFSRRAIQERLDALGCVLEPAQLENLARRLNRRGSDRLPAMWESVWLHALSTSGRLSHERALRTGRKPDFELILGRRWRRVRIVGDISTVSDIGLDEQNPVETFSNEIVRLAKKHGLQPNHFHYQVEGGPTGHFPKNARMRLNLPSREKLLALMRTDVEPFFKDLRLHPRPTAHFVYDKEVATFSIDYDQSRWGMGGGHLSYGVALSLSKNPVANALRAKATQLRAAPWGAVRLIILCDGDCDLMRNDLRMAASFDRVQIVKDFLRQNSSIDLVLLVGVKQFGIGRDSRREMRYELVSRSKSQRLTPRKFELIEKAIETAKTTIPIPMRTPENASWRCRAFEIGPDRIGGYKYGGTYVTLSSRAISSLLAGEISSAEFAKMHGWDVGVGLHSNPFKQMLQSGRMIRSVTVEPGGDKDDDSLRFEFGPPDTASAPFSAKPS